MIVELLTFFIQGSLVFEIVPPGLPYFTLDGTTGQITLAESVLATSSPDFEVNIVLKEIFESIFFILFSCFNNIYDDVK